MTADVLARLSYRVNALAADVLARLSYRVNTMTADVLARLSYRVNAVAADVLVMQGASSCFFVCFYLVVLEYSGFSKRGTYFLCAWFLLQLLLQLPGELNPDCVASGDKTPISLAHYPWRLPVWPEQAYFIAKQNKNQWCPRPDT